MTHDPLCEWRPCTCPLDYDVPERGHMIGCPEDDCECEIIAKVRADERKQATTAKATVHVCADNNCWCPKSLSRSELS